jgi:hypothetical protein
VGARDRDEPVGPARRAVEAAQDVEERRLPGARGSDDRDDDEVDGAEGVDLLLALVGEE